MSMLSRRGTFVRNKRGSGHGSRRSRRSVRSTTSSTSTASASVSGSFRKQRTESEVTFNELESHQAPYSAPLKSFADVVASFDDERQLVRTSVGLDYPGDAEVQPDYDAFLYQIREANKESDNIIDFGCKTSNIICNTLFVTVLVGLFMAVPVAMVSVGVKYLEDCPKEPRIPIYLLVGGCFGMIKLLSTLWRNIQARRYHDVEVVFDDHDSDGVFANTTYRTMDTVLFLFLIGWQAAGTYWTLQIWLPHFHQLLHEPSNWCDKTVYMFTIYQLGGSYGVMVVFVLVLLTLICCQRCCYR